MIENRKDFETPSLPPSYAEAFDRAKRQIDWSTFDDGDLRWLNEITAIIGEIYALPSTSNVRISGEWLPSNTVKGVFEKLNEMHIKTVIMQYNSVSDTIRNPKAYMRTLLYNSIFSFDAYWTNQYKATNAT